MLRNIKTVVAGLVALAALTQSAPAATILLDTFTATNGTAEQGRTPDSVNLPGGTWNLPYDPGFVIENNMAQAYSDAAAEISIASFGAYVKPTLFKISADVNVDAMDLPNDDPFPLPGQLIRGVEVGFFDDSTVPERRMEIGLVFSPRGKLLVVEDNVVLRATSLTAYDTTATHNISYWVNTSNGQLSDVRFDGASVTFDFDPSTVTSQFTDPKTNIAGFYGSDGVANAKGFIDNFTISDATAVPEPTSAAALTLGLSLLGRRRRAARAR